MGLIGLAEPGLEGFFSRSDRLSSVGLQITFIVTPSKECLPVNGGGLKAFRLLVSWDSRSIPITVLGREVLNKPRFIQA